MSCGLQSSSVAFGTSSAIRPSGGGRALAGFLLSGFLMALLGAILPAWGYHRDPPQFIAVGNYFLSLAVGIVLAAVFSRRLMGHRGLTFQLVFACALSCVALLFLALVSPMASIGLRIAGLLALGIGAGLLNVALFQGISERYQSDAAGTVSRGGIWYGLGCLAVTLLVAGTFYAYSVPTILITMAAAPAIFGWLYARTWYAPAPEGTHPTLRQAIADFRSPGAVLFAILLFVQFGNEWSVAGWLPLFLIRRVGLSPSGALLILALFWLFLMIGRLAAVALLSRIKHAWLLLGSGLAAMFGCIILFFTNNGFGAGFAVFFIGAGYASIYPLVAEAIGRRFPYYHPGFFNGIFSLALVGGLMAPATLGYAASFAGVGVVIGIPLIGTITVMALLLLIWLESKITGR
jgi:MFS transporter, FHS family, glucose/mannose:H+ symporter